MRFVRNLYSLKSDFVPVFGANCQAVIRRHEINVSTRNEQY
jgi:hypothetical protein